MWVRGLPGRVLRALGDLRTTLVEAGKDLIRGLWDGIVSLGGWLWDKVTGFVGDNVEGAIDWMLSISSPSGVGEDKGRSLIEGLLEGIEGEEGDVIAEIERFANEMSSVDMVLGSPSIGAVEDDIDRAAARRRNVSGDDGRPTQHTVDRSIKEMTVFATDWKNAQRQIEQRQRIERLKGGPRE